MYRHIFLILRHLSERKAQFVIVIATLLVASPALAQEAPAGRSGSILNVLLLGCIAYFLIRSFRRRSGDDDSRPGRWNRPDQGQSEDDDQSTQSGGRAMNKDDAARQMWDMLKSDSEPTPHRSAPTATTTPTAQTASTDGFDEVEFLEGAKFFYARFQQAADERDFDAIRDFISDDIYTVAMAHAGRGRTEIMLLNARIMEVKVESGRTLASVFYDAQLRIGEAGDRQEHVRAVWEFAREESSQHGLWVLEKINRVDQ